MHFPAVNSWRSESSIVSLVVFVSAIVTDAGATHLQTNSCLASCQFELLFLDHILKFELIMIEDKIVMGFRLFVLQVLCRTLQIPLLKSILDTSLKLKKIRDGIGGIIGQCIGHFVILNFFSF